jgi:hypothetical protein
MKVVVPIRGAIDEFVERSTGAIDDKGSTREPGTRATTPSTGDR